MSDLAVRIGLNIRTARESLGCSQRELARRLGMSNAIVPMWEAGKCEPSASNLVALPEVLFIPVEVLLDRHTANPETRDAVTWWSGYRFGWRACALNVQAASALDPTRMPPRSGGPSEAEETLLRHQARTLAAAARDLYGGDLR